MAKFKGWIDVVLCYELEAVNQIDAEIQLKSAINRIQNQDLIGVPDIKDWGISGADESSETAPSVEGGV